MKKRRYAQEPKFMQELHKIREELTKEWKNKSTKEIAASFHCVVKEFKANFASAHR